MTNHADRMDRARLALDGLSVGDAFGERFFGLGHGNGRVAEWLARRTIDHPGPWRWTDDTAMALSVVEVLDAHQRIDQAALARHFCDRWRAEPWRGYGRGAHELLEAIRDGAPWQSASSDLFGGSGSFGNGAAMRVAPIGAYFADHLDRVVDEARVSAAVTHAHPEGQAGAIAIAVAAAVLAGSRAQSIDALRSALWTEVLARTPDGPTRAGIERARETDFETCMTDVVRTLGNGEQVSSQDTVPLCVWAIARHPRDFEAAMWTTVQALGDRDTTCAIVGGVVAQSVGRAGIPVEWLARREPLSGLSLDDYPVAW